METVQGYVILKAATFETGHGFALGHNPGAPSPFVTWQFTEGENGHRDYYWGRYGTSQAWAQRDFDRRMDDYQQFYHAAVKHTELGPEGVYRYYSTQRPDVYKRQYICYEEDAQESVVLRELLDKKLWNIPDRIKDKGQFEEKLNQSIRQYHPEYWRARHSGREAAEAARSTCLLYTSRCV